MTKTITATELARNLRRVLDGVEFKGDEVVVVRNGESVARILPGPGRMTAMDAMGDLHGVLAGSAGDTWERDGRSPETLDGVRDPWAT